MEACELQRAHLQHIAGHLPTYLPSLDSPGSGSGPLRELSSNVAAAGSSCGEAAGGGGVKKPARPVAPRRFISQEELESVSSYMRGRLTTDRINAALDEMAGVAEVGTSGCRCCSCTISCAGWPHMHHLPMCARPTRWQWRQQGATAQLVLTRST